MTTPGVENASCEFDVETLAPTYRVLIGIPGKSNAFAISRRLGLPESVIQKAAERIDAENVRFEDVLTRLEEQRQQMELSKETVELINIKCHDIRKQLYTLGSRVPTEELDELKKGGGYLRLHGQDRQRDVGRAAGGALHRVQGPRHPAGLHADGAKLDFLKPGEVYSLFGNALDNAIEAVTPLEPDRRYIGLQVRAERGMLLIRMENCAAEPLRFVDGLPQTTKGDAGGTVLALRASAASCSSTAAT